MPDRIAILGWGSLLWDPRPEFDQWHNDWQLDGPLLKIEFSRISISRAGALTLVLDSRNGADNQVAYCLSKRGDVSRAMEDLRLREGTTRPNIGFVHHDGRGQSRDRQTHATIATWSTAQRFDAVVWTDLQSNFPAKTGKPFSVDTAMAYLQRLPQAGRRAASEYINKAPAFVATPLRRKVAATHA